MASNMLKLNEDKTELLYIQSRFKKAQVQPSNIAISKNSVQFSKSVKNLGMFFGEHMKMDVQIKHIWPNFACMHGGMH